MANQMFNPSLQGLYEIKKSYDDDEGWSWKRLLDSLESGGKYAAEETGKGLDEAKKIGKGLFNTMESDPVTQQLAGGISDYLQGFATEQAALGDVFGKRVTGTSALDALSKTRGVNIPKKFAEASYLKKSRERQSKYDKMLDNILAQSNLELEALKNKK